MKVVFGKEEMEWCISTLTEQWTPWKRGTGEHKMPMDRKRYPPDWKRIATEIKEAAGWKCQKCGKQCRRPGEPFDTHKRTLTVAHLNHTPEDIRPENLQAMCAPCHLKYDAQHHAETRRNRKKIGAKEYADYGRCLMEGLKAGLQSEE